jgi:predicted enzyme related to lactoylglutathione lyase
MDALYTRLLVSDFAACFRFYHAALPELIGAKLIKGEETGPYANWDLNDEAVLVLFDRGFMAGAAGTADLPAEPAPHQDTQMLVLRVDDVDAGARVCVRNGARLVAEAQDRPQWGENLRTAHLRDPQGTLIELQAY